MTAHPLKKKKKPTERQIKAVELMLANNKKPRSKRKTKEQILLEAGYAATTAKTKIGPIQQSDGWKALMNQYLPDDLLIKRHRELLNKRETMTIVKGYTGKGKDKKPVYEKIDLGPESVAVAKALDMGYKLKGTYAPEKSAVLHAYAIEEEDRKRIDQILEDNS